MKFQVGGLIDKCENCGFKALLYLKTMVRPEDVNSLDYDSAAPLSQMKVCPTCVETPSGCKSPNIEHRRLPEFEYKAR